MDEDTNSSTDSIKPPSLEPDIENQMDNTDTVDALNNELAEELNEDTDEDVKIKTKKPEEEKKEEPNKDVETETTKSFNATRRPTSYRRLSFDGINDDDKKVCKGCLFQNNPMATNCIMCNRSLSNDTVDMFDSKLNISNKSISSEEFNNLKTEFNKYSKNDVISYDNFYKLINPRRTNQDFFLNEYLRHVELQGNNGYSFMDLYTVIQHLKNLKNIRAKDLLQISEDDIHKSVERRKLEMSIGECYDEMERERDYMELEKQKFIIAKNKELLEAQKKYENEVQLYTKDLYGLTCASYCKNTLLCCTRDTVIKDFDKIYEIIKEIPTLNNYEKNLILMRFQTISAYCTKHYNTISRWYNHTQIFIIACSIVNPALLSINSNKDNVHYYTIFWSVWLSQLLVSLTTSYISFFKWDKKYFLFNCYKTKINQEIWLFIELSGSLYKHKDEDKDSTGENNHSMHLKTFLTRLESLYKKLKMTEFEIETANNDDEGNKDKSTKEIKEIKDEMRSRSSLHAPISPGVSYREKQHNRDRERDRDREMY